jgi:hypothetical protein
MRRHRHAPLDSNFSPISHELTNLTFASHRHWERHTAKYSLLYNTYFPTILCSCINASAVIWSVNLRLDLPLSFARAIHLRAAFEPSLAVFQLALVSDSIAVRLTHLHLLRMISILAASVSAYPVLVSRGLMVPAYQTVLSYERRASVSGLANRLACH